MKKLINRVFVAIALVLLSACSEMPEMPGYKVQIEPLPIPILIVPDHSNDANKTTYPNNNPNYQYQQPSNNKRNPQPYPNDAPYNSGY